VVLANNHSKPPMEVMKAAAESLRDLSRSSSSFKVILDDIEGRFGDIEAALLKLDFVSADSAYLLQPQKDGTYQPVVRNVRPGQLATALERGFLPVALSTFEEAQAASEDRTNSGESEVSQAESQPSGERQVRKRKPRPFKCSQCPTSTTSERRLNIHISKKHGDS